MKTKPKRFGIVPELVLLRTDCFDFGPESAPLDQIEMISFGGADWGTNSDIFVSFLLDVGPFAKRLWNICSFTVLTLIRMRLPLSAGGGGGDATPPHPGLDLGR